MAFWQVFIALSLVAAIFLLWPAIVVHARARKRQLTTQSRGEVNEFVYKDHMRELEATHGRGEIQASELASLKNDLENTLIDENAHNEASEAPIVINWRTRIPVFVLALAVPLVSLYIYSQVGASGDWEIYQLRESYYQASVQASDEDDRKALKALGEKLLEKLQLRLEKKPDNGQSWYLLGTVATQLAKHDEAVRAFRRLLELAPNSPDVTSQLAQSLFRQAGSTVTPEVRKYIGETLAMEPGQLSILGLAGMDAFQSKQYAMAVQHWSTALARLDKRNPEYKVMQQAVSRAKSALAQSNPATPVAKRGEVSIKKSVSVHVALGEGVEIPPEYAVFVYARAWQGARMPLAIQRFTVAELPRKVLLDESMAMTPSMTLASVPQLELVARVSKSGTAVAQPGDWQANFGPIVPGENKKAVELVIDTQVE